MSNEVGFVQNVGTLAHYMMLERIKLLAEGVGSGWTVLRYDTAAANRELILQGEGFSGTEQIFVGFRTYQDSTADYYNLVAAAFTGYVSGNTFDAQPGAKLSGVPAHNNRIDYWLTLNKNRIALAMKVGTPVYESCYVGKFLPYANPSQYPYPVICAGMLDGVPATRFSDTAQSMPYKGNRPNFSMRFNDGAWKNVECWPWNNTYLTDTDPVRDTEADYKLLPVVLSDANGIYGELDGIYQISGFNNAVENTADTNKVVIQDVYRTGFTDYYALTLDA